MLHVLHFRLPSLDFLSAELSLLSFCEDKSASGSKSNDPSDQRGLQGRK